MPPLSSRPDMTPSRPNAALSNAYVAVRTSPKDVMARFTLAALLLDIGRHDLALRHAERAATLHPDAWSHTLDLGKLLFRLGSFLGALRVLQSGLKFDPNHGDAHRTLSAIFYGLGDKKAARHHLKLAAQLDPIERPLVLDRKKPTILRLRQVDTSHYGIQKNTHTHLYHRRLKGGHFSLQNMLTNSAYNMITVNLTEDTLPPCESLPQTDVIINNIACADLSPGPLRQADLFLKFYPFTPVINPPKRILQTTRKNSFQRLSGIKDIVFPRTHHITLDTDLEGCADHIESLLDYPLLLRRPGTQTGESLEKIDHRTDLLTYIKKARRHKDLYAIEYINTQRPDGLYGKTRAFFIDGQLYPVAHLVSDHWQIHSGDRYRVMADHQAAQDTEKQYLRNPDEVLGTRAIQALHAVADVIKLDFFGIDFTVPADGRVLIFEANASMRHNFDHVPTFPYTQQALHRVSRAFKRMVHDRIADGKT